MRLEYLPCCLEGDVSSSRREELEMNEDAQDDEEGLGKL